MNAVLTLACRPGAVAPAAQVRAVFQQAVPDGWASHGPGDGWTARRTAAWVREAPPSERDGDWIAVVEQLLAAAVDRGGGVRWQPGREGSPRSVSGSVTPAPACRPGWA